MMVLTRFLLLVVLSGSTDALAARRYSHEAHARAQDGSAQKINHQLPREVTYGADQVLSNVCSADDQVEFYQCYVELSPSLEAVRASFCDLQYGKLKMCLMEVATEGQESQCEPEHVSYDDCSAVTFQTYMACLQFGGTEYDAIQGCAQAELNINSKNLQIRQASAAPVTTPAIVSPLSLPVTAFMGKNTTFNPYVTTSIPFFTDSTIDFFTTVVVPTNVLRTGLPTNFPSTSLLIPNVSVSVSASVSASISVPLNTSLSLLTHISVPTTDGARTGSLLPSSLPTSGLPTIALTTSLLPNASLSVSASSLVSASPIFTNTSLSLTLPIPSTALTVSTTEGFRTGSLLPSSLPTSGLPTIALTTSLLPNASLSVSASSLVSASPIFTNTSLSLTLPIPSTGLTVSTTEGYRTGSILPTIIPFPNITSITSSSANVSIEPTFTSPLSTGPGPESIPSTTSTPATATDANRSGTLLPTDRSQVSSLQSGSVPTVGPGSNGPEPSQTSTTSSPSGSGPGSPDRTGSDVISYSGTATVSGKTTKGTGTRPGGSVGTGKGTTSGIGTRPGASVGPVFTSAGSVCSVVTAVIRVL